MKILSLVYCAVADVRLLCMHQFLKLSFRVSMETGAQAPAGETEWDQCCADHGSLPLCQLCAHQRPPLWAWWTQGLPHWPWYDYTLAKKYRDLFLLHWFVAVWLSWNHSKLSCLKGYAYVEKVCLHQTKFLESLFWFLVLFALKAPKVCSSWNDQANLLNFTCYDTFAMNCIN